jgi:hypothetical protein
VAAPPFFYAREQQKQQKDPAEFSSSGDIHGQPRAGYELHQIDHGL